MRGMVSFKRSIVRIKRSCLPALRSGTHHLIRTIDLLQLTTPLRWFSCNITWRSRCCRASDPHDEYRGRHVATGRARGVGGVHVARERAEVEIEGLAHIGHGQTEGQTVAKRGHAFLSKPAGYVCSQE